MPALTIKTAALALLAAPVLEEVVFRLGLHESLLRRHWPAWQANGAVALAFGTAHGVLQGSQIGVRAWATALPAVLIGLLYQRYRRVWPCVLAHAACNAIWWLWL